MVANFRVFSVCVCVCKTPVSMVLSVWSGKFCCFMWVPIVSKQHRNNINAFPTALELPTYFTYYRLNYNVEISVFYFAIERNNVLTRFSNIQRR